jgi:hypothetical protein
VHPLSITGYCRNSPDAVSLSKEGAVNAPIAKAPSTWTEQKVLYSTLLSTARPCGEPPVRSDLGGTMEKARQARGTNWNPPVEELAQGQPAEAGLRGDAP